MRTTRTLITVVLAGLLLSACVNTNAVILDESKKYAPSESVQILEAPPEEPYEVIAQLETRGAVGKSLPELLQNMRQKAKEFGADAIIPTEERSEQIQQGILYGPWLGYYLNGKIPVLRGYAIILESSKAKRAAAYRPQREFSAGAGVDGLSPLFGGFGISGWMGKNKLRVFGEFYSNEIPDTFFRDGFKNGKIDSGIRVHGDYFFSGRLSGLFFTSGFDYTNSSVGHRSTITRGDFEVVWFSAGLGYLWRFSRHFHIDSRIVLDAMIAGETEVRVGNQIFVPDRAGLGAFLGVGINL